MHMQFMLFTIPLFLISVSGSKLANIDHLLYFSPLNSKEATLSELDRISHETSYESTKAAANLDYEKALQGFEQAYEQNKSDAEVLFMLGLMKSYGIGCLLNPVEGLMFLYIAAKLDDQRAQSALGFIYQNGLGVEKNCKAAKKYYYRSARADAVSVRKPARLTLQSINLGSEKLESHLEAIEYYEYSAKSEDPSSHLILAQLYYFGTEGKDPDFERARVYFEKAALGGKYSAFGFLGQIYYFGEGVEKDFKQAYIYFSQGSEKNVASAINGMGLLYWKGDGVEKDLDMAEAYFKRAAELKFPDAFYNYAMVLSEQPSAVNFDLIFQNILAAVKSGYVFANIELTKRYLKTDNSCKAAVSALRQIVEKGPILKLFRMAHNYYTRGLHDQALSLYMYLSAQGLEVANYNAAFVLEQSDDKLKHQNRALFYYHRSALLDNSASRKKVGDSYYLRGDVVAAVAHYVVASRAQPPSAESLFNLGYAYENGKGLKKNYFYALDMYNKALKSEKSAKIAVNLAIAKLKIKMIFDPLNYRGFDKMDTKDTKQHFLMLLTLIISALIYWYMNYFHIIERRNRNPNPNRDRDIQHDRNQNNQVNAADLSELRNQNVDQGIHVTETSQTYAVDHESTHSIHSDSSSSTLNEHLVEFSFKIPEKKKTADEFEEVD